MKKIGTIISDEKIKINGYEPIFNFIKYKDLKTIDKSLPMIFFGYRKVKELFKDKVNILNYNIQKDIYWNFTEDEDLNNHHSWLNKIINDCISNYFMRYNTFQPIFFSIEELFDDIIMKENNVIISIYKNLRSMYILNNNNDIYCLDLRWLELIDGFWIEKTKKYIKKIHDKHPNSIFILDNDYNIIGDYKSQYKDYYHTIEKYIPALHI